MPAYRSAAEAEVRDAVVARLRTARPDARIIHEINVSTYGPNRIDLLAVSPEEIIAVEVKSAKDKLDRLEKQVAAMRGCAHHVIAAVHEKFLVEDRTNEWCAHYSRDGVFYRGTLPASVPRHRCTPWVFPERRRAMRDNLGGGYDDLASWVVPATRFNAALPSAAIDLLWRDELAVLCGSLGIASGRRSTMADMTASLRWHCTGRELTRGICAALRRRECVEADPAVTPALNIVPERT